MSTQKQLLENMLLQSILNSKGANLVVDGIIGSKTQAAMQKYLGVNAQAYGGATSVGQSMSSCKSVTTAANSGAGKAYYVPTSGASAQTAAYTRPQPLNQQERDILGAFKSVGTPFQKKMFLKEIEENGERAVYNKYVESAARERERMEQESVFYKKANNVKNSVTSSGVKTEAKKPYESGTTFTSTFDGMAEQVQAVIDGLKKGLTSMEEKPRATGNGRTTFTPMYGETGSEVRELLALYGITPGQLMQSNPKSTSDRSYALNGNAIPDSIADIQSMRNLLADRTALEKQGSVSHALSGGNMGQGQVKSLSTQSQDNLTQAQRQEIRRLQQERDKQLKIIEQLPAWERTTALGAGPGPRCAAAMQRIREIDREIAEVGSTMMIPAQTPKPMPMPTPMPTPTQGLTDIQIVDEPTPTPYFIVGEESDVSKSKIANTQKTGMSEEDTNKVIHAARDRLGRQYYVDPERTKTDMTCDKLTKEVYSSIGINLGGGAANQAKLCEQKGWLHSIRKENGKIVQSDFRPGDLIFWTNPTCNKNGCKRWEEIHHVAIVRPDRAKLAAEGKEG